MPGIILSMTSQLNNLPLLQPGIRTKRISSYDHSGGNNDFVPIGAGETKTLAEIDGAGIIKHLWITVACADPLIRRNAILRMFWDGESSPSVEVPLGDFFGQGWGEKYNYVSLPLAAAPAGGNALNCYFPMPFGNGARLEVENQSELEITNFYYYVDYEQHPQIGPEQGRFHAWWNRQRPGPEAGQGDRENEWETLGVPAEEPVG